MEELITLDQDIYFQYSDGKDLLSAALVERRQLLAELENLVVTTQETRTDGAISRFDIMRGQTLLYELSFVTERIDTLTVLINGYADQCGEPHVEIVEKHQR